MQGPLVWIDGKPLDRVLQRLGDRVSRALGRSKPKADTLSETEYLALEKAGSASIDVVLPRSTAFYDSFGLPDARADDLSRIVANDITRLAPLPDPHATVLASRHGPQKNSISLVHIRADRLQRIEEKAAQLGLLSVSACPEDAPSAIRLPTPATSQRIVRERRWYAIAGILILIALWSLLATFNFRAQALRADLEANEQVLRTQLLERRTREREIGALGQLAQLNPERRSPMGRLAQLEALVVATPKPTWWKEITLDGTKTALVAQSRNAGETLYELTNALSHMDVQFASAVSETAEGQQSFKLNLVPRDERNE